jgi:hypothetical protein
MRSPKVDSNDESVALRGTLARNHGAVTIVIVVEIWLSLCKEVIDGGSWR